MLSLIYFIIIFASVPTRTDAVVKDITQKSRFD